MYLEVHLTYISICIYLYSISMPISNTIPQNDIMVPPLVWSRLNIKVRSVVSVATLQVRERTQMTIMIAAVPLLGLGHISGPGFSSSGSHQM